MKYCCTLCNKEIGYTDIRGNMISTSLQICQILMKIEAGGDSE
jgi:hypothetical protein